MLDVLSSANDESNQRISRRFQRLGDPRFQFLDQNQRAILLDLSITLSR